MSITSYVKSHPSLKKLALWLLAPKYQSRPRLWVRTILNPIKNKVGKHTTIRNSVRMDVFPYNKFEIGEHSIIESFSTINNGVGDVIIGNDTIVGLGNVVIGPVHIGNGVMLAQNIVLSGMNHSYQDVTISPRKQKETCKQITIGNDVWVGANCVITAGVTIGRHCVIGAGSVVTKSIDEYSVAIGNPARVIKKYNHETETWESCK